MCVNMPEFSLLTMFIYSCIAFCGLHSSYSINNLDGGSANSIDASMVNLTCSEQFYQENLTCIPQCDAWSNKPPSLETTYAAVVGTVSVLGTICGLIGIFASFVQYKSM